MREIAPDPRRLHQTLKRAKVENAGTLDDDALAGRIANAEQILCIVNTERHARELFARIAGRENALHLSAAMCPKHREDTIARAPARRWRTRARPA